MENETNECQGREWHKPLLIPWTTISDLLSNTFLNKNRLLKFTSSFKQPLTWLQTNILFIWRKRYHIIFQGMALISLLNWHLMDGWLWLIVSSFIPISWLPLAWKVIPHWIKTISIFLCCLKMWRMGTNFEGRAAPQFVVPFEQALGTLWMCWLGLRCPWVIAWASSSLLI